MNIFVVDKDPSKSAIMLSDKHVIKMILESSQLLCTAHHICGAPPTDRYFLKKTHINHPCNKWSRQSINNYRWLANHNYYLCKEYTHRYNKIHKVERERLMEWLLNNIPDLPNIGLTNFALAMPDEFKTKDVVKSYRLYYNNSKAHLFSWKNREKPFWIGGKDEVSR